MNYQKHYDSLINKAIVEKRKRYKKTDARYIYYERHHIIPRCLEGNNNTANLVLLTPEEHYLAHLLLIKIYPENHKLIFAAHRMCSGKYRNNKMYGWIRRKVAEALSKLHTGKKRSAESIEMTAAALRGRKHSPETIENMRLAQQNRSDETRKRISESHKGHVVTDETRKT